MPIRINPNVAGERHIYGNPFVGDRSAPVHVQVDVSTLTSAEVDANGYLKPGVLLTRGGKLIGADHADEPFGMNPEAVKIADGNTGLASITNDPFVVVYMKGMVNRDIVEDNLGRALNANELAAIDGEFSQLVLTLT